MSEFRIAEPGSRRPSDIQPPRWSFSPHLRPGERTPDHRGGGDKRPNARDDRRIKALKVKKCDISGDTREDARGDAWTVAGSAFGTVFRSKSRSALRTVARSACRPALRLDSGALGRADEWDVLRPEEPSRTSTTTDTHGSTLMGRTGRNTKTPRTPREDRTTTDDADVVDCRTRQKTAHG